MNEVTVTIPFSGQSYEEGHGCFKRDASCKRILKGDKGGIYIVNIYDVTEVNIDPKTNIDICDATVRHKNSFLQNTIVKVDGDYKLTVKDCPDSSLVVESLTTRSV